MARVVIGIIFIVILICGCVFYISNRSTNSTTGTIKKDQEIGKVHTIDVEGGIVKIGKDKNDAKIQPEITLAKWEDSNYLKLSYPIKNATVVTDDNIITWKSEEKDLYFKQLTKDSFEFDITLHKKPESNVFSYNIDTQNLDFFYQPELTETEKLRGNLRPENVIGSYAVYYKDGISGNYKGAGGKNYKTGKAFHIYRPKILDANGNSIWGDLKVDKDQNKLLVTVPQDFLDKGRYPIIVDPTFGYTSVGASAHALGTNNFYNPAAHLGHITENGDITSISAACYYNPNQGTVRFRIYGGSANSRGSLLAQTGDVATQHASSGSFQTINVSYSAVTGTYWLEASGSGNEGPGTGSRFLSYDTGGAANEGYIISDLGQTFFDNSRYSVYATYAAASTPTPTPSPTPTPVFSGPNSPGTISDDAAIGSIAWINPNNTMVSDNVYATATAPDNTPRNTHYLKAINFGFNIPPGSTIDGIVVSIERKREIFFQAVDNAIRIVKSNGSIGTTNRSTGTSWLTSEGYVSFGGTTDLWGETWTYSDINSSNFGVAISPQINMTPDGNPAYIDHVRMTVYYSPPPGVNYRGNINLKGNVNLR